MTTNQALRAVAKAKANVDKAQAKLDEALLDAVDLHVHNELLRDVLGDDEPMSRSTFYRRIDEARGDSGKRVFIE